MDIIQRNFLLLKLAEILGVTAVLMIVGTTKLLGFRPVIFKYPKRESRVSAGLFIILFLVSYFYSLIGFDFNLPLVGALLPLGNQLILALLALGITAIALFYRQQPLLSAGWGRKQNLSIGLRLGIMLSFLVIFLRGKIGTIINGVSPDEGMALVLLLAISLAEESVFRGYLQLRFSSWNPKYGWLLTAGLFVLWRLPLLVLRGEDAWIALVLLAAQSVLLGWIMKKSGHVAAPALYRTISEWLTLLA